MAKTKVKYQFAYSGNWEGIKVFYKLSRLLKFLQKVPPNELKLSRTLKFKDGIAYMGQYFVKSRGGLSIKF